MTIRFVIVLVAFGVMCGAESCAAVLTAKLPLWPEAASPDFNKEQTVPFLSVSLPENRTCDALIVIAPGGSYMKWGEWEGKCFEYFNRRGMATALLRYRTPRPLGRPKHVSAWQDAQRAVRLCRVHAAEWGLGAENIGFMGFSAGGNLALLAATSSQTPAYRPMDAVDEFPCHVNWAVVCYPAYVLSDCTEYDGTNHQKGNPLDLKMDPIFKFDVNTPPMCLLHGDADAYSPMGSVRVYHRLRTMGIPAELHVFAQRGHASLPRGKWCDLVWDWLEKMDIAAKPKNK